MSLPLQTVIVLSVCLPVMAIAVLAAYSIGRGRRKNGELEEGSDEWKTDEEEEAQHVSVLALNELELVPQPSAAIMMPDSKKASAPTPKALKRYTAVWYLRVVIYTRCPNQWLSMMRIEDASYALLPQVPNVVYTFYFNPMLLLENESGGLEEIDATKVRPRSVVHFRAKASGVLIETEIDGIISEPLTQFQTNMVDSIARPQKFVSGESEILDALQGSRTHEPMDHGPPFYGFAPRYLIQETNSTLQPLPSPVITCKFIPSPPPPPTFFIIACSTFCQTSPIGVRLLPPLSNSAPKNSPNINKKMVNTDDATLQVPRPHHKRCSSRDFVRPGSSKSPRLAPQSDATNARSPFSAPPLRSPVPESPAPESLVPESPVQDIPVQDIPVQDIPVQEIPVQEIPVPEIPVSETPVQDSPVSESERAYSPVNPAAGEDDDVPTTQSEEEAPRFDVDDDPGGEADMDVMEIVRRQMEKMALSKQKTKERQEGQLGKQPRQRVHSAWCCTCKKRRQRTISDRCRRCHHLRCDTCHKEDAEKNIDEPEGDTAETAS
ncbi:hypothetical protein B0J13DRAFT_520550 [Dactylonectria estremocensis]|uniref:Uncharacterized protein n=1 Tax=Dactylonectria estremocensis TaxID=1079267 RepID=A0A9P9FBT5_9HYPO|nr:hypothetical protein B0J13DRAFT_520550 [Dactylonectria estremocensis]